MLSLSCENQKNPSDVNVLFKIPMSNKLIICKLNVCLSGFWKQVIYYLEEFRCLPLLKLWLGPWPYVILYHQDTVEVSP